MMVYNSIGMFSNQMWSYISVYDTMREGRGWWCCENEHGTTTMHWWRQAFAGKGRAWVPSDRKHFI